jgi:hypothetical protein
MKQRLGRIVGAVIVLGLIIGMPGLAGATPVTYIESGTGSGTLGTAAFTDALVTITMVGDTSNITGGPTFFSNTVGTFTLNVAGVGTATFTDSMEVFVNQTFAPPAAGIGDLSQGPASVLDTLDSSFGSYALTAPFGPVTNTAFIRPDVTFNTTLGGFNIQSMGPATFQAIGVPEPSSIVSGCLAIGVGGIACVLRRLRKRR